MKTDNVMFPKSGDKKNIMDFEENYSMIIAGKSPFWSDLQRVCNDASEAMELETKDEEGNFYYCPAIV